MHKEMNWKRKKIVLTILTIVWILLIFQFSLREGHVSSKMSGSVVAWMADVFHVRFTGVFVRKLAHFVEYTILGILLSLTISYYREKKLYFGAWLFGTAIAGVDESIQHFIPGRSGNFQDTLLDSSGVLFGVLLIFLFSKIQKIRTVY